MSYSDGAPGVEITEVDQSFYVRGVDSSIPGFVGVAEWGPIDAPTLVTSWPEFERTFGSFLAGHMLAYVVKQFFDEGGGRCYVVRATERSAGVSTATQASLALSTAGGGATKARETGSVAGRLYGGAYTWQMASGNKLSFRVDSASKVTVTIAAAAATKNLTNAGTFSLSNAGTVKYRVGAATEPERTVTLDSADFVDIGNATVQEVQAVLARDMRGVRVTRVTNQITLTTDVVGSGARLEFTSGTMLTALGLSVETRGGSGNVADVDHVTVAEMLALVQAADTGIDFGANTSHYPYLERNVAGLTKTVQVVTADGDETAGAAVFGFATTLRAGTSNSAVLTLTVKGKYKGSRGADISIDTAAASVSSSTRGKLVVRVDGTAVETYDEYSLDPTDTRYLPTLAEGSDWITIVDEDAFATVASYVTALPATGSAQALTSGTDGISGIAAADYLGSATYATGLHAFDATDAISQSAIPGITDRDTAVLHVAWAAARKNVLAVLDCPDVAPSAAKDYRFATGAYVGGASFDSSYGALYYPWIKVSDPIGTTSRTRLVPPSGAVCAAMARADRTGEWKAPAGPDEGKIATALGLSRAVSPGNLGDLYLAGVNCIVSTQQHGIIIRGQKTLQAVPSDYSEVKIRRGAIGMRKSLQPLVETAAEFEPNDQVTWTRTKRAMEPYLDDLRDRGRAFTAYRLVCDATTNTPSVRQQRRMVVRLYVQYTPTAEYVEVPLINVGQNVDLTANAA